LTSEQKELEGFDESPATGETEWKEVIFSDVIEINDYPSAEKGEKYKSVGMSDVAQNVRKIQSWEVKEYSYSRPRFRNGQTLMARITPCLENGKTAFVDILDEDESAIGSTEFIVLSDTTETLPKFVYYTARRPEIRQFSIKRMTGTSGRQRVPLDIFDDKKIKIPPITEQKKIVEILDALDRKIEVNNRVNENLEKISKALFKSWFVEFEPYDTFKETDLGKIPEDFEVVEFSDISNTEGGGTPDTEEDSFWGEDILWLTPKEVAPLTSSVAFDSERELTKEGLKNTSAKVMPKNSTLLYSRGANMGVSVINKQPMATNQGFVCIEPDGVPPHFLFHLVTSNRSKIENRAGGSTYPEISQTSFNEIQIAIPSSKDRIKRFESIAASIYEDVYNRVQENVYLSELRDTLLSKLMSGDIRVNDINLDNLEVDCEV
jgi:type I restriction enzyme S subunit